MKFPLRTASSRRRIHEPPLVSSDVTTDIALCDVAALFAQDAGPGEYGNDMMLMDAPPSVSLLLATIPLRWRLTAPAAVAARSREPAICAMMISPRRLKCRCRDAGRKAACRAALMQLSGHDRRQVLMMWRVDAGELMLVEWRPPSISRLRRVMRARRRPNDERLADDDGRDGCCLMISTARFAEAARSPCYFLLRAGDSCRVSPASAHGRAVTGLLGA